VVAWPWRLRHFSGLADWQGRKCIHCQRDIAVPEAAARGICIYCALDRGIAPAVDEPFA
jgi:hypothetical protein